MHIHNLSPYTTVPSRVFRRYSLKVEEVQGDNSGLIQVFVALKI